MADNIDIIIPFKYGYDELHSTLASILTINENDIFRVICVCHIDVDIDLLMRRYQEAKCVKFLTCVTDGIYPAMNSGLKESTAGGFMFMGAGDLLEGNAHLDSIAFDRINILTGSFMETKGKRKNTPSFRPTGDIYGLPLIPYHASIIYPRIVCGNLRYDEGKRIISDRIFTAAVYKMLDLPICYVECLSVRIMPDGVSSSANYKMTHLTELLEFSIRFGKFASAMRIGLAIIKLAIQTRLG